MVIFKLKQMNIEFKKSRDLHSNMVIFKLYTYYKQIYSQSNLHSNMVIFKLIASAIFLYFYIRFTFQYGDIQIDPPHLKQAGKNSIYIPIW